MTTNDQTLRSSFRDPSGFVYTDNGSIYRQVNDNYRTHYEHLMSSGLYATLVDNNLLLSHDELPVQRATRENAYKIIKPERVGLITYPYEWCFSQLRDAALTTLEIQRTALNHGMTLKDASAFNVQFQRGKPILIDTLSFETYRDGQVWTPYRQFCQHFLAPLALMSRRDIRLGQLMRIYIDGIPLDLASSLLPLKTRFGFSLLSHIHLHARSQKRYSDRPIKKQRSISRRAFAGLIDSLAAAVSGLAYSAEDTEWADYYNETNYSDDTIDEKDKVVSELIKAIRPESVWDLGGNTGRFSRLASARGIPTVSLDSDPAAVEKNYLECRRIGDALCLPLLIDLTNPSPGIGWNNEERKPLFERGKPDCLMALALIHHMAISNNVPLEMLADFFADKCKHLILEFVPKSDSQVKRLLRSRQDIFEDYTQSGFEAAFGSKFLIKEKTPLPDSHRIIYLLQTKRLAADE